MRAISSRRSNGLVRKSSAPKPRPLILWSSSARPERIRIGVRTRAARKPAQHLVTVDVRQHQIENDDVVIVELADLQPVFAEIGGIADEALPLQHHLDAGGCGGIVLNQKHAHQSLRLVCRNRNSGLVVNHYPR